MDIEIAEDAPDAIARGEFRAENGRVFEKEANVGEFGLETREEIRERFFVVWKVLVVLALIVIQITCFAEFKLHDFLLLIVSLHLLVHGGDFWAS